MHDQLLVEQQYKEHLEFYKIAVLSNNIAHLLIDDKNGKITPNSFIKEFKAVRFLDIEDDAEEAEQKIYVPTDEELRTLSEEDRKLAGYYIKTAVNFKISEGQIEIIR